MAQTHEPNPSERNKMIAAIVLGTIAIISVGYLLFSGGTTPPPRPSNSNSRTTVSQTTTVTRPAVVQTVAEVRSEQLPTPVDYTRPVAASSEVGRNIFGFYEAPQPQPAAPKPSPVPSPTPPPPLLVSAVSPQTVFARTGDFNLEVNGDKFVPGAQVYVNEAQVPTKYVSPQLLSAKVPAAMITNEGARQVIVRAQNGKLYSNNATLVIQAPPAPNFNFIGFLRTLRMMDTAMLEDKGTHSQVSVQRGDVVGGRFRVSSISEREIVLIDTSLRIKHSIPFSGGQPSRSGFSIQPQQPQQPPQPPADADESEDANP
jgi:hypothetical protein